MHRNTKAVIKACEKASTNLRRDLSEIIHLQISRNLKNFLINSQLRFEKNISFELDFIEPHNIIIYEKTGSFKDISVANYKSSIRCLVIGIDNVLNLSHGIEHVAFAISIMQGNDLSEIKNVLTTAICVPNSDAITYTETDNEAFLMRVDGHSKKLRINTSTNVVIPSVLCSTDHHKHKVEELLAKREVHFVSSGSILCDAVRVLENKIDIALHDVPDNLEYITAIRTLVRAAGGADAFIDNTYAFGKKSIVQSILQSLTA